MRAAPIALGVSCTALALLLSLRGEEPAPPRVVRERHQYHQPVPPASHAATLPARLPDNPASRHDDEAPLPAACVPGRLCATPQRPYTIGGASAPTAPLRSAGLRQAAPAVAPHAPAPEPHTRTPALPSGAAMLRVRAGPGAPPLHTAVLTRGVGRAGARDFECPEVREALTLTITLTLTLTLT